jgi:tRNA1Val (adenine37-N6)-methyltransferase
MFHFKYFSLYHDNSALKISTDAVLLAAVTPVGGVRTLLDIGCGCGVIAYCLAWKMQRECAMRETSLQNKTLLENALQGNNIRKNTLQGNALSETVTQKITGIDIDKASVDEALKNLEIFPKTQHQKISFLQQSLQDFAPQQRKKFDLIVSNPPFFVDSLKPNTAQKNISKHNDTLPFEDLRDAVCQLLEPDGYFYLILPANESEIFEQLSQDRLFKHHQLQIQPTPSKPVNRIITGYRLFPSTSGCKTEQLCLRHPDGSMSEAYRWLTRDFLIKS